jgi:hypothetical protein
MIAVDDCLVDGDRFLKVTECPQLVLFMSNSNVKLLDSFKGKFILLHKDTDRITKESFGYFKEIERDVAEKRQTCVDSGMY